MSMPSFTRSAPVVGSAQAQAPKSEPPRESALARALRESAQARTLHRYPESGLLGGKVAELVVRVPTKLETDQAIVDAHKYIDDMAGKLEPVKGDADLLLDTKSAAIVARALRDSDDPSFPAFPNADFVQRHLTSDQIASMVHLLNDARDREPGAQMGVTQETISFMVASARWLSTAPREHAVAFFARMNRERLIELVIALASLLGPESPPPADAPPAEESEQP